MMVMQYLPYLAFFLINYYNYLYFKAFRLENKRNRFLQLKILIDQTTNFKKISFLFQFVSI